MLEKFKGEKLNFLKNYLFINEPFSNYYLIFLHKTKRLIKIFGDLILRNFKLV